MSVVARAKTNLFLEVPARRRDGFHELDTVFVELELCDRLEVEAADGLSLTVGGPHAVDAGPDNLVLRAAERLRDEVRRPELGARLSLTKQIPAGGGLGGGSSDAAAALRALNSTWELGFTSARLAELGAELGSDVAFFVEGGIQRGVGRGELLTPLPLPARPLELVLVFPGFPCPTPDVYRALAPHLPGSPRTPDALLAALAAGDVESIGRELFNRLAAPAFELFPQLAEIDADLRARDEVEGALLSGSGSTLLCLTRTAAAAQKLAEQLRAEGSRAVATRTVARG